MIISRVRRTLLERKLIERGMRALVACSGGPDSAAMLAALARLAPELGFRIEAASVDHGLREGAARDVEVARGHAEKLAVPFHPIRIEVGREGSLQAMARSRRYRALKELADEIGAQRIAVGHTMDDQAETVIMRLLRGAGLGALSAIAPLREDGVIRPLIDCERGEAHRFARSEFARIADDPSNLDNRFERVRVRLQLLPALLKEDPAVVRHLARLADEARASEQSLLRQAESLLARARNDSGELSRLVLAGAESGLGRAALRLWIRECTGIDPGHGHLAQIDLSPDARREIWLPEGWVVEVGKGLVRCYRRN